MLKVLKKKGDLVQVIDTVDNAVESVSEEELRAFTKIGVNIIGVSESGISAAKDLSSINRKIAKSKLLGKKIEELEIIGKDSGLLSAILSGEISVDDTFQDLRVIRITVVPINDDVTFYEYKMMNKKNIRNTATIARGRLRKSTDDDGRNTSYILATKIGNELIGLNLINITNQGGLYSANRRIATQYLGVLKHNVYSSSIMDMQNGSSAIRYDLSELCYGVCDVSTGKCTFYSTLTHAEVEPKMTSITREEHLKIHKLIKEEDNR